MIPRILIIAGSDSGGGAGIQADIKTVTMLGGHAMTAVTAITAQNTLGVQAVHPVPTDMVLAQIGSVASDIGVDAVKIGMIGSAETAHAVADLLSSPSFPRRRESMSHASSKADRRAGTEARLPIVFDPVMVATSGSVLADGETIAAFERLMRIASVVTPNIPELEVLAGTSLLTEADALAWAADLARETGAAILAKGGHRSPAMTGQVLQADGSMRGTLIADNLVLPTGDDFVWTHERIDTDHTHGTGCTLATGIACGLAIGMSLPDAIGRAVAFVQAALAAAPGIGAGHGPMGHALGQIPYDRCRG